MRGGRRHIAYFYGSDVSGAYGKGAGAAFNDYMIDNIHLPLAVGEARYKIIFRLVQGGKIIGDGEVQYGTSEQIGAIRTAQARAAQGRARTAGPSGPGAWVPPHSPPAPEPPTSTAPVPPSSSRRPPRRPIPRCTRSSATCVA